MSSSSSPDEKRQRPNDNSDRKNRRIWKDQKEEVFQRIAKQCSILAKRLDAEEQQISRQRTELAGHYNRQQCAIAAHQTDCNERRDLIASARVLQERVAYDMHDVNSDQLAILEKEAEDILKKAAAPYAGGMPIRPRLFTRVWQQRQDGLYIKLQMLHTANAEGEEEYALRVELYKLNPKELNELYNNRNSFQAQLCVSYKLQLEQKDGAQPRTLAEWPNSEEASIQLEPRTHVCAWTSSQLRDAEKLAKLGLRSLLLPLRMSALVNAFSPHNDQVHQQQASSQQCSSSDHTADIVDLCTPEDSHCMVLRLEAKHMGVMEEKASELCLRVRLPGTWGHQPFGQ